MVRPSTNTPVYPLFENLLPPVTVLPVKLTKVHGTFVGDCTGLFVFVAVFDPLDVPDGEPPPPPPQEITTFSDMHR